MAEEREFTHAELQRIANIAADAMADDDLTPRESADAHFGGDVQAWARWAVVQHNIDVNALSLSQVA